MQGSFAFFFFLVDASVISEGIEAGVNGITVKDAKILIFVQK